MKKNESTITSNERLPINGHVKIEDKVSFLELRAELMQRLSKNESLSIYGDENPVTAKKILSVGSKVFDPKVNIQRPEGMVDLSKDPFHAKMLNPNLTNYNKLIDLVPYSKEQTLNDDTFLYQIIDALIFLVTYD